MWFMMYAGVIIVMVIALIVGYVLHTDVPPDFFEYFSVHGQRE